MDIKKNCVEEITFKKLGLENSILILNAIYKSSILVTVTLRRI
jgi:hypothetical protein